MSMMANTTYTISDTQVVLPYHYQDPDDDCIEIRIFIDNDVIENGSLKSFMLGISDSLDINIKIKAKYSYLTKDCDKKLYTVIKREVEKGELKIHLLVKGDKDEDKGFILTDPEEFLTELMRDYTTYLDCHKRKFFP